MNKITSITIYHYRLTSYGHGHYSFTLEVTQRPIDVQYIHLYSSSIKLLNTTFDYTITITIEDHEITALLVNVAALHGHCSVLTHVAICRA